MVYFRLRAILVWLRLIILDLAPYSTPLLPNGHLAANPRVCARFTFGVLVRVLEINWSLDTTALSPL